MKKKPENQKRNLLENFESQFKKSTLPLMVLKILSEREMYAYEITQIAFKRSNGKYKMPLLYTTLSKLQDQGFVEESNKVISEDNRVRIYYRLTDEGYAHLEKLKDLYADLIAAVQSIVYDEE
ncbi:MAG: PadR family transcriptional regulator [Emergencia sp.]